LKCLALKTVLTLRAALLLAPLAESHAQAPTPAPDGGYTVASQWDEFVNEPLFVPMQKLWENRCGWGGILTTNAHRPSPWTGTIAHQINPGADSAYV